MAHWTLQRDKSRRPKKGMLSVHLKAPVRSAETLGLMTAEARIGTNQKEVFISTCDQLHVVEPLDSSFFG